MCTAAIVLRELVIRDRLGGKGPSQKSHCRGHPTRPVRLIDTVENLEGAAFEPQLVPIENAITHKWHRSLSPDASHPVCLSMMLLGEVRHNCPRQITDTSVLVH